jgi:acylphosphatase
MPDTVQAKVLYAGEVQGVGFRWRATRTADPYEVTGFVRNLPDGRVELVAEGERGELERFLAEVARRTEGLVASAEVEWAAAAGGFEDFGVRY